MSGDETALVPRIGEAIKSGTFSIADIMRSVGVARRNVKFNTALWNAQEELSKATGAHVVERNGEIVILDRGEKQLHVAINMSRASYRKRERAIRVARDVQPGALDPVNTRRRERFLEREDGRAASDQFAVVKLTQEQILALQTSKPKRERRPRDE